MKSLLIRASKKLKTRLPWSSKSSLPQSPLLSLPNELLLLIAGFLDAESKSILGFTCHHFRVLLTSFVGLPPLDIDAKYRFLRHFESNFPSFLPCRRCGSLFNWTERQRFHYLCPCMNGEDTSGTVMHWSNRRKHTEMMHPEIIDLVFRSVDLAKNYGLPRSEFKIVEWNPLGIPYIAHMIELHIVKHELLARSRWQGSIEPAQIQGVGLSLDHEICMDYKHEDFTMNQCLSVATLMKKASELSMPQRFKCAYCATDSVLYLRVGKSGKTKIFLDVRMNFGPRDHRSRASRQINDDNAEELDKGEVAQRNLHALF